MLLQADVVSVFTPELDTPYAWKFGANNIGSNFYQAVLGLKPCVWIVPHFHPEATEFNYITQGEHQGCHVICTCSWDLTGHAPCRAPSSV